MHSERVAVLLFSSLLAVTFGPALGKPPNKRPKAQEQFISFVNENGQTCAKETATVTDNEARFDVNGQMAYVFDYQQEVLVFKEISRKGTPCYYVDFDTSIIPSLDELKILLVENKFKMPEQEHKMNVQASRKQTFMRPVLLPLSENLCQNSQVVLLEQKTETSSESIGAVAQRNALRPKREVGWGEVVVIIIVIIILL